MLVAQTGKLRSLPSNPFDVFVSPLKALISDQPDSCQTLKLKAVKMKLEQFDKDDKLKESRVLYSSPAGTKRRSQVTGHRSQVTGHRSQVTGHRLQVTENSIKKVTLH